LGRFLFATCDWLKNHRHPGFPAPQPPISPVLPPLQEQEEVSISGVVFCRIASLLKHSQGQRYVSSLKAIWLQHAPQNQVYSIVSDKTTFLDYYKIRTQQFQ
jgi:hypothetical protein